MKKNLLKKLCKLSLIAMLSIVMMSSASISGTAASTTAAEDYSFPAEWEKQSAVWLAWYEYPSIPGMHDVTAQIIENLQNVARVKVDLIIKPNEKNQVINFLKNYKIDTNSINFHEYNNLYIYTRDLGPAFVKNSEGKAKVMDFNWNFYGAGNNVYDKLALGYLDRDMARQLNLPTVQSSMVAEGGGYEVNGNGVMMGFKDMALNRNPGKTIEEIESEILRMYGYKKMIWIDRSPLADKLVVNGPIIENFFGYGANGHIDEFARFVDPHTILVAEISKEARDNNTLERIDYEIVEEMVNKLKTATDIDGKPFNIIRMPAPDLSDHWYERLIMPGDESYDYYKSLGYKDGDKVIEIPAVSYLNFLITNNAVIAAKYWEPGKSDRVRQMDEQAKEILQAAFPNRKIVQINPMAVNGLGGGIHCITQQQPLLSP
ncbi:agmatine deiminase family protein [Bacillus sp. JJ1764]|uniref:agmatine deiminase family protein n=1 Tax=Bacillus sp. JJ1764 TaxID=3122964 RepID=UPI003000578B